MAETKKSYNQVNKNYIKEHKQIYVIKNWNRCNH